VSGSTTRLGGSVPAHRSCGQSLTARGGPYRAPLPRTRTSTSQPTGPD
jgi:hypothetical protein